MFSPDGKLNKVMELFGNYCLLNVLWIISCIPIVTISPSTTAMLGVIKEWSAGNEPPIIKTFFYYFKKHFSKSIVVGIIQLVIAIILIWDLLFIWNLEGIVKALLLPLFILFSLFFLFMSSYIYPLMIEYDMTLKQLIRNSFYLTISRPASPTVILLFVSIITFLCTFISFLPFLIGFSMTGFICYQIVRRTISKVEKMIV